MHAFDVEPFEDETSGSIVRFSIHPFQRDADFTVRCAAAILDQRMVTDSGGHSELRYVIRTLIRIGTESFPIEITLTNRDDMRFRMLLGRTAMKGRYRVDPALSYRLGRRPRPGRQQPPGETLP